MTSEMVPVRPREADHANGTAALAVGGRGVLIADMDSLARFAGMYYRSGLAPKGMNEAAIGVAVQMGLEVGLTPAQAVQSIAVINGRPGLFGPAALALVEASGLLQEIDEHYESNGKRVEQLTTFADTDCAVITTRRRGRTAATTRFSVADAKRARLWTKQGPWTEYPARMLKWRARGFNLSDNFGDVLKGLKTVEELRDYPDGQPPKVVAGDTHADTAPPADDVATADPAELAPFDLVCKLHQLVTAKSRRKKWLPVLAHYKVAVPDGWKEPTGDGDLTAMCDWLSLDDARRIEDGFTTADRNSAAQVAKFNAEPEVVNNIGDAAE